MPERFATLDVNFTGINKLGIASPIHINEVVRIAQNIHVNYDNLNVSLFMVKSNIFAQDSPQAYIIQSKRNGTIEGILRSKYVVPERFC